MADLAYCAAWWRRWPGLGGNWAAAARLVSLKADDDHQYVVVVVQCRRLLYTPLQELCLTPCKDFHESNQIDINHTLQCSNITHSKEFLGNQEKHQNFDPSILPYFGLIFMGMQQKIENGRLKKKETEFLRIPDS